MNIHIKFISNQLIDNTNIPEGMVSVINELLISHAELTNWLESHNEAKIRSDYDAVIRGMENPDSPTEEDLSDSNLKAASLLDELHATNRELTNINQHIMAITYFLSGKDRNAILQAISKKTLLEKHDILTKWAWIYHQHKEHLGGRTFNHMYRCRVGYRLGRQNIDREFFALLHFLPAYYEANETGFLYLDKPDPPLPDFILEDDSYNKLGIEITEAPLNSRSSFIEKQGELFKSKLSDDLKDYHYDFCLIRKPEWTVLYDNYSAVIEWLISALIDISIPDEDKHILIKNTDFDLTFWVFKSTNGFNFSDMSGLHSSGNQREKIVSNSVIAAIENKYDKTYDITYPNILVIYNNTGIAIVNFQIVREMILKNDQFRIPNAFSELWLMNDESILKTGYFENSY